jgi:predicted kinase
MTIYLVGGLPGSGKSSWCYHMMAMYVKEHAGLKCVLAEADDFFMRDGVYEWKGDAVPRAHEYCREVVIAAAKNKRDYIFVANTFTQKWETNDYRRIAKEYGYQVIDVRLFDAGLSDEQLAERNLHGVPVAQIKKMRDRWDR